MTSPALLANQSLRAAIVRNMVSFPAQIPAFANHHAGDVQVRMVQLYFLAGWTIRDIAQRYDTTTGIVRKKLTEWRVRAVASGYIQEIGPEVLSTLPSSQPAEPGEGLDDFDSEQEGPTTSTAPTGGPLLLVTAPGAPETRVPASVRSSHVSVLHMVLEELESAFVVSQASLPEPFYLRLLQILKQECSHRGPALSAFQVERIEAAIETQPERTGDLLRDLHNRIVDEEQCTPVPTGQDPSRAALLHVLLGEIETALPANESVWPRHCIRFLAALKLECRELGMEFSLVQVNRIEDALTAAPQRMGDLLRDLRNRMADEQDHAALICIAAQPRQRAAGVGR